MDDLITEIDAFLARHEMAPTAFGQMVLGDRHFVRQLRDGRDLRMSTVDKVRQFMATYSPESTSSPFPKRAAA